MNASATIVDAAHHSGQREAWQHTTNLTTGILMLQVGEHDSPFFQERINEKVLQQCPVVQDAFKQAEPVSIQCLLYLHADWSIKGQCYFVWFSSAH